MKRTASKRAQWKEKSLKVRCLITDFINSLKVTSSPDAICTIELTMLSSQIWK